MLRERLRGLGSDKLSNAELLALVLGHGHRGVPVEILAGKLLLAAGDLRSLMELEVRELEHLPGLGPARAARLLAAFELGRRACRQSLSVGQPLQCAREAAVHFLGFMRGAKREEFHSLLLDSRHCILASRLVSIGSLQSSIVHPREVFRPAIRLSAAALVVAHNHPSGDPTPSEEDRAITDRLREAGALVGIQLLDHLVIGEHEFYSFADDRVIPLRGDGGHLR